MKTTISSKGRIVLPAEFRQMDGIEPGQEFDVERLDRGEYRLVRRPRGIFENLDGVRRRARRVKGVGVKDLIEEGRR